MAIPLAEGNCQSGEQRRTEHGAVVPPGRLTGTTYPVSHRPPRVEPGWSEAPLTLGELIDLGDGAAYCKPRDRGLYFGGLWYRIRDEEMAVGELHGWWAVESDFYPDLSRWYDAAFEVWAAAVHESGGTRLPSLSSARKTYSTRLGRPP
jgi:hypothetical protein